MLYTAAEIIVFLIASAVIGVLVGYLTWGRKTTGDTHEITTLQRQLAATRKRAAAAEAEATNRGASLNEAKTHFAAQQSRIEQLESQRPAPPSSVEDDSSTDRGSD